MRFRLQCSDTNLERDPWYLLDKCESLGSKIRVYKETSMELYTSVGILSAVTTIGKDMTRKRKKITETIFSFLLPLILTSIHSARQIYIEILQSFLIL